jgi:hypothetical protein
MIQLGKIEMLKKLLEDIRKYDGNSVEFFQYFEFKWHIEVLIYQVEYSYRTIGFKIDVFKSLYL